MFLKSPKRLYPILIRIVHFSNKSDSSVLTSINQPTTHFYTPYHRHTYRNLKEKSQITWLHPPVATPKNNHYSLTTFLAKNSLILSINKQYIISNLIPGICLEQFHSPSKMLITYLFNNSSTCSSINTPPFFLYKQLRILYP